jgi:hypothetical protein
MCLIRIAGAGAIAVTIIFAWPAESNARDEDRAGTAAPASYVATAPPETAAAAVDNETADPKPGRFAVRVTSRGTILVDTVSGQSWMLMPYKGTSAWLPIERIGSIDRLRELGATVSVREGVVREVDLTNSTIADADMEFLGTLTSLEQLILNGCANLTDAGLAPLQRLTGLTGLALERTNFTDAGLANLRGLTDLRYLSLSWMRTSDIGMQHLEGLKKLEVLYLCDTDVADASLASLNQMHRLQWLDLRGTNATDAGLSHLARLPQLRLLSLYGTQITDAGVPALTELSNLEVLTLAQTQVSDAGLRPLSKLVKLNDLDLAGSKVTPAGVAGLQRMLPDCRVRFESPPPQIIQE